MIIYNDDEIAAARRSNQVVARILDELGAMIKPGLRTRELDGYAEARTRELGAVPAFKGYRGYPATLCTSVNEEIIHGIPSDRVLREGDLVGIDFGVVLFKNLTLGAALKYRDGTPFAFLDSFVRNGQRIITYRTIKAENDKGVKGGPRKDYLSDVSVRLAWAFTLFGLPASADAAVFNFLDFGSELSEYVFGSRRYANELQLPRSFRLGLAFSF